MNSVGIVTILIVLSSHCFAVLASPVQTRLNRDIAAGKPIIIQVSVALADNKYQWIVPVPVAIGNGQDARTNLYWGARYGVKTYMMKDGAWNLEASLKPKDQRILERLVLRKEFRRNGYPVTVYLVADAWDGRYIVDTIKQFMRYSAGHDGLVVKLNGKTIEAGANAHLIAYIGHNALMDYAGAKDLLISTPKPASINPDNDSIVLACKSQAYFSSRLEKVSANPLLVTTGLMAPEAYSLDAAITQWTNGGNDTLVRKAAAKSYHQYQKTGIRAAERLFGVK